MPRSITSGLIFLAAGLFASAAAAQSVDLYQSLLSVHAPATAPQSASTAAPLAVPAGPVDSNPPASNATNPSGVVYADFQAPASPPTGFQPSTVTAESTAQAAATAAQTDEAAITIERPRGVAVPLDRQSEHAGLPLQPPGRSAADRSAGSLGGMSGITAVASSLAIVLGLFFVFVWLMRRSSPSTVAALPAEVIETLGKVTLGYRQQVNLVRCGNRLLLLSVTPAGVETLSEYADPDEVTRLVALCRQTQPGSASTTFRQVFHQLAGQPAETDRFESGPAARLFVRAGDGLEDRDV